MLRINDILRIVVGGIIVACLLFCMFLLSGCRTPNAPLVPQRDVHTETNDSAKHDRQHDSIFIDRWHTRYVSGDTVYIHDSIYIYNGKEKADTVRIVNNHTDTIHTPPVIVEKQLTGRQVFLIRSGVALWIVLALLILAVIIGIVIKFAK